VEREGFSPESSFPPHFTGEVAELPVEKVRKLAIYHYLLLVYSHNNLRYERKQY